MWQTNPMSYQNSQSRPQHLKNFNAYDILEPEKVSLTDNSAVTTAVLVDISNDTEKANNSLDMIPDLHGSFMDKINKKEYNLLDLYQNIYVTPQHIKHTNTQDNDSKNDDFAKLFEKTEQRQQSDTTKCNGHCSNTAKPVPLTKTGSNDEILDNATSSKYSLLNIAPVLKYPDSDRICEDIIDDFLHTQPSVIKEVLTIPSVSKLSNDECHIPSSNLDFKNETPKIIGVRNIVTDMQSLNISNKSPELGAQRSQGLNSRPSPNLQKTNLCKNKTSVISDLKYQCDVTTRYQNDIKPSLDNLNSPSNFRSNSIIEPVSVLQTVKMDTKLYNKRRIVKKDSEKKYFTKGPDIYEKSLVLPQIMNRLAERKNKLDEQRNFKKKLILQTSVKRDRMQSLGDLQDRDNVYSVRVPQITKHLVEKKQDSEEQHVNKRKLSLDERKQNQSIGEINLSYINRNSVAVPQIMKQLDNAQQELNEREIIKRNILLVENEKHNKAKSDRKSNVNNHDLVQNKSCTNTEIVLQPEVLMVDCSKERLINLKTRIAFEKFVTTGNIIP